MIRELRPHWTALGRAAAKSLNVSLSFYRHASQAATLFSRSLRFHFAFAAAAAERRRRRRAHLDLGAAKLEHFFLLSSASPLYTLNAKRSLARRAEFVKVILFNLTRRSDFNVVKLNQFLVTR
jgi:hypothetical protein